MREIAATIIRVQSKWDGWQTAEVRLHDLHDVHWLQPRGAPRQLVHGYVSCADIKTGAVPHNCAGTGLPHHLLVCVLKTHTSPHVFAELERRANTCAVASAAAARPGGSVGPASIDTHEQRPFRPGQATLPAVASR